MKSLAISILSLFGYLCLFFAVVGGILGIFDYQLVISGSKLSKMDGTTALIIGSLGAVTLGLGLFLDKRAKKKQQEQQGS